ncbi:hypothetical protein FHS43_004941 [Streptosporangium becharense]|uniref:DUF1540 domain-containing protein n=1 Tax=Streptosporangium becharense TaxID=1816182 RepID=A0A7W9IBM6_9ACTN|nr:DUF1540 domain-containing protein [Streptosporangium becharense]MBB2913632.1 hypothetical protein [Streptosporangium becharense]MBB5817713.1 hypothetical protein [Streptosporangium becharense]
MDMPVISECRVEACAYNTEHTCHARAITVGDTHHAECETFFQIEAKGGDLAATGRVGACKMADCHHNVRFECQAPGIVVGYAREDIDCLTYDPA